MKTILLLLFIIISIPVLCSAEEDILTIQNNLITVQFERPLTKVAETVIRLYPDIKLEIEQRFRSDIMGN